MIIHKSELEDESLNEAILKKQQNAEKTIFQITELLENLGIPKIDIFSRVKSEKSIKQKIQFLSNNNPKFKGKSSIEILNAISDIAAFTVASENMRKSTLLFADITEDLHEKYNMPNIDIVDYVSNPSRTDYKVFSSHHILPSGDKFEIQFTDYINLKKRNDTHAEYHRIKYENNIIERGLSI